MALPRLCLPVKKEGATKRGRGRPRKEPRDPGTEQAEGVRETVVGVGEFVLYPNCNALMDVTFRVDYPKIPGFDRASTTFKQKIEVKLLLEHESMGPELRNLIRHRIYHLLPMLFL